MLASAGIKTPFGVADTGNELACTNHLRVDTSSQDVFLTDVQFPNIVRSSHLKECGGGHRKHIASLTKLHSSASLLKILILLYIVRDFSILDVPGRHLKHHLVSLTLILITVFCFLPMDHSTKIAAPVSARVFNYLVARSHRSKEGRAHPCYYAQTGWLRIEGIAELSLKTVSANLAMTRHGSCNSHA